MMVLHCQDRLEIKTDLKKTISTNLFEVILLRLTIILFLYKDKTTLLELHKYQKRLKLIAKTHL